MKSVWNKKSDSFAVRHSIFIKLAAILIVVGLVPLLVIGGIMLNRFIGNMQKILLNNTEQMNYSAASGVEGILRDIDDQTMSLYRYYTVDDYSYLHDLLLDETATPNKKSANMNKMLNRILNSNSFIKCAYFIDNGKNLYYSSHPDTGVLNREKTLDHIGGYEWKSFSDLHIFPTHRADYYYYDSDTMVVTFARRYMNTATIWTASSEVLGTLYIDVAVEQFAAAVEKMNVDQQISSFCILDTENDQLIYQSSERVPVIDSLDLTSLPFSDNGGYLAVPNGYLVYNFIPKSSWIAITALSDQEMTGSYEAYRRYTLTLLLIASFLLCLTALFFSRQTSKPIRQLKSAMIRIENGRLDTRVHLNRSDELSVLADGLNHMAENLNSYIQKSYVAEIKQKETELEVLKVQIQPHYLYNTLEVIKMTALDHGDHDAADMLNSLSHQLRYLISSPSEVVMLKEEIENIRNYFKIIKIRYENRFQLELCIPEELLNVRIPKLILQPVVENSVQHGLLPAKGAGKISITAQTVTDRDTSCLVIEILDNGLGLDADRLAFLQSLLKQDISEPVTDAPPENIGLKNVHDRIRLYYGDGYGICIESWPGLGTLVQYRLPVLNGSYISQEKGGTQDA